MLSYGLAPAAEVLRGGVDVDCDCCDAGDAAVCTGAVPGRGAADASIWRKRAAVRREALGRGGGRGRAGNGGATGSEQRRETGAFAGGMLRNPPAAELSTKQRQNCGAACYRGGGGKTAGQHERLAPTRIFGTTACVSRKNTYP